MKKYKFRVWIPNSGEYDEDCSLLFTGKQIFRVDDYGDLYEVNPENIAQLVAFDDNHNALYEDDVIYPDFNPNDICSYAATPYSMRLEAVLVDKTGRRYFLPKGFVSL